MALPVTWNGPAMTVGEVRARRQERERLERAERERRHTAVSPELEARLVARVERGDLAAMHMLVMLLARKHRITIEVRETGGNASAKIAARRIIVPPLRSERDFAAYVHEMGHVESEPCRGGLHQRDLTARESWCCIRCEELAWRWALNCVPFSRPMFQRLQECLASYRFGTPAPAAANQAADRLRGTVTFADAKQQRLQQRLRLEQQQRRHESPLSALNQQIERQRAWRARMHARAAGVQHA
jgi:hypothetical protein